MINEKHKNTNKNLKKNKIVLYFFMKIAKKI